MMNKYFFEHGHRYIFISFGIWFVLWFLDFDLLSFLSFLAFIFIGYSFFKKQRVKMNFQEGSIYAPCEGSVKSVEKIVDDKYGKCTKVVVENGCLDYSLLASPLLSHMSVIEKRYGSFLNVKNSLSQKINEKAIISFEKDDIKIVCEHIVSTSFDGIKIFETGDIKETQDYGFMLHGESIIYLSENIETNLRVSQKLRVKESVIGTI
jgi:hypothetical protein